MRTWLIALVIVAFAALPAMAQDEAPEPGKAVEEVPVEETVEETTDVEVAPDGDMEETDTVVEEETMEEEVVEDTTLIPFGLKWGMQQGELSELGIKVKERSRSGELTVVSSEEIPDAFADTKLVNMLFDRELGLVKVRWISYDIETDPDGSLGRSKYGEMKAIIASELGDPTDETLVVGARLFDQQDEFYQCLAYEGCGVWSALWEHAPSGGVLLSVEGTGPGTGFVQMDYESINWQQVASPPAEEPQGEANAN